MVFSGEVAVLDAVGRGDPPLHGADELAESIGIRLTISVAWWALNVPLD